jgi:Na+-driven multidrug efflux pump
MIALETGLVNFLLSKAAHATQTIAAYSIYTRVTMFSMQPVIAISVAMLPYAARRFGARDFVGIRKGLRDALVLTGTYTVAILAPVMLAISPWLAASLSESPITTVCATFALWLVPLACLTSSPFMLCRPVFEAMNRGRPGLYMAVLRYVILAAPLAWGGMALAERIGQQPLYGLIIGLLVASSAGSAVFYIWLRSALPAPESKTAA